MGLLPSPVLCHMVPSSGFEELWFGAGVYIFGIVFFKSDGYIPFAHAIWHIFVITGAYIHFLTVQLYLINT